MGEGCAFEGMTEAIAAGKVRFPAFTSHDIPFAMQVMREGKYDAVQLCFNYVDDEAAKEAIPLAKELDMGFIAMKPFGGGLLHNANTTIKYLSQFDNIIPDPGIEKLSEMEEIVQIIESGEKFTAEDAATVEKMKAELGSRWCHKCDYCKPCAQGINISSVLTMESMVKRLPYARVMTFLEENMANASGCTQCGECMPRCPYNLNIPMLIKEKLIIWNEYLNSNKQIFSH